MKKMLGVLLLSTLSFYVNAQVIPWKIDEAKSSLNFVATQNNAPVKGSFKKFSGDVQFDKQNLAASKVKLVVETGSVSTSYKAVADTLKTDEWFNEKKFPKATFESKSIQKLKENQYQAQGTVTIRDKSAPVSIDFTLNEKSPQEMEATGEAKLKRTQYGVGQGDWADTKEIKDEVTVDFHFILVPGEAKA